MKGGDLGVAHCLVLDSAGGLLLVVAGGGFPQYLDYIRLLDDDFIIAIVVPFLNVDLADGHTFGPNAFDYAQVFLRYAECGVRNR